MAIHLNKQTLKYLAELSRIELNEKEEEKLLLDLEKIIDYFNELKELDTSQVEPMTGGTLNFNIFRDDDKENPNQKFGRESFPETQDGFLKVPKVL